MFPTRARNMVPAKVQESFLQDVIVRLFLVGYFASHVGAGNMLPTEVQESFPTKHKKIPYTCNILHERRRISSTYCSYRLVSRQVQET